MILWKTIIKHNFCLKLMANMESIRNFFSIKLLQEKFPVMLQFKLFSPKRPSLRLHHQNLLFCLIFSPALGTDTSLPEVSWIPGGLRGPRADPNTGSSLKCGNFKLKTYIWDFWANSCWAHRPAGFLNFSTGNLFADPNNVKFWNRKKILCTTEPKKGAKPVSGENLAREGTLWERSGPPPAKWSPISSLL